MLSTNALARIALLFLFLVAQPFVLNVSADPVKIFICSDGTFAVPVTDYAKLRTFNFDGSNPSTARVAKSDSLRGCQFDSTIDKFFFIDLDPTDAYFKIYKAGPDYSNGIVLQRPIPFANPYDIFGGFAIDSAANILYFPDSTNWEIKYASSLAPIILGPPVQNEPQTLNTTPGEGITTPFDVEIDAIHGKLYVANGNGGITRINLDGSGSERVIVGGPGVFGVALDPIHNQIFYTLENNQVWTANLDGSNPTELTDVIGPLSDFSHRRMDIDYEPETEQIYWVEWADPNPPFGASPSPGKLRRANPDGSGATDLIADLGYRALFLSFEYGTIKPSLHSPAPSRTYVTSFPLAYSLAEPPSAGTVRVELKQSNSVVASMTLPNFQSISTVIQPFATNINSSNFVISSLGFPVAPGTYDVTLSYQDAAGHIASTDISENVTLTVPTATPTNTPTPTNTAVPTATFVATNPPEPTATANPQATEGETTSSPTPAPGVTPTISNNACISAIERPQLRIKRKKVTLQVVAKKGAIYKFLAKPVGNPKRKSFSGSVKASKIGRLTFSFTALKPGLWEFSYTQKIKKASSQSCAVSQTL